MSLFSELKRRNVLRIAAAYIAVSWLLIQVVETLFPVFGLSDAAIRTVVIVLAIGFIPAVIVAWAFELTPAGLVRDSEVDRGSAAVQAGTKRLDRVVMVALALAVGYFAFDKFMLDPARDEAREQAIAEAAREQGRTEAAQASRDDGPPVLAVLPFSAVTATEDSVFFAAGVHDDLLTKLAQLSSMLVISRTSVLEYKDTQENIRDIGAALGADAILEGGVQSAGNRIRINAQLIDTKTDEHLWADTFDAELTAESIFDVQDDIARAIADALHIELGTQAQERLIPTSNMTAYRAFHEAMIIRDTVHGGDTTDEYRDLLRKALDIDPGFNRARALLVGSYALDVFGDYDPEAVAAAEVVLEEFQAVAPDSVDYLVAQTYYTYYILKDYDLALQLIDQALERTPSDIHLVSMRTWIQRRQGDQEGRLETLQIARKLEPGNPSWSFAVVNNLMLRHLYDEALAEINAANEPTVAMRNRRIWLNFRDHGDPERVVAETEALATEMDPELAASKILFARVFARDFDGAAELLDELHDDPVSLQWGLSEKDVYSILVNWLMGESERVAALVAEARGEFARQGTVDDMLDQPSVLSVALLAAVEGDREETRRLTDAWHRGKGQDLASRLGGLQYVCQTLGISGAAEAAVNCIREGLEQPNSIAPFIEPHLPFYDPIRNEPVFVELVQELNRQ
jgi:TolB-like protein